jgi:hypothetical protein
MYLIAPGHWPKEQKRMKMFAIDETGKIEAVDPENVRAGQTTFTTERELGSVTSEWSGGRLVEIWNQLPRVTAAASLLTASLRFRGSGKPFRR